jgi:hypothetical protein
MDTMTSREAKILAAVQPEFETKAQQTLEQIKAAFDAQKKDVIDSFHAAIAAGLKKVAAAEPQKGAIEYIYISFLLSSLLSGKCEYRIDFYNSACYLDEIETECYWEASFVEELLSAEPLYFNNLLKKTLIRVMDYEVSNLAIEFSAFYYSVLAVYFRELLESVNWKPYQELLAPEVNAVYGGYLDQGLPVTTLTIREKE